MSRSRSRRAVEERGVERPWGFVVSCEHGGREVPARYRPLFEGKDALLDSHRGWDPGTLELGRRLARALGVRPIATTVTRLLVDANRSEGHRNAFSELTRSLPREEREGILRVYHRPHRAKVAATAGELVGEGCRVLHLGVHSFTPVLDGVPRNAEIGLLYDPRRAAERYLGATWADALRARVADLRVRRNYPYLGSSDGLTTTLRRTFPPAHYLGFEVEVSQGLLRDGGVFPSRVAEALVDSLREALGASEV